MATSIAQPKAASRLWLVFALVTTVFWGVWGAFIDTPAQNHFPETLGYCVWALTMIPCALVALKITNFKLEHDLRSILLGCAIGLTGAGGQLVLFKALRIGPAYLVFPIVSMYPVLTVILAVTLLRERAKLKSWMGIVLALPAIVLLSYQPPSATNARGYLWLLLAFLVATAWGLQAYVMKFATNTISAEGVFFYMMATAIALIPVAIAMTDFSQPINWGFKGPYLAALIQVLNSIGALCLVYAVRHGKAIIVVPMTSLAPMLTVVLSLILYHVVPSSVLVTGMVLAAIAMVLMAE